MSAREAMRGFETRKIGYAARDGVDSADAHHGEADPPRRRPRRRPIEPGHRGGTEGDPAAVIREPFRGFVDFDLYANRGKRERGSRAADTASNHYRAHARPALPSPVP